MLKTLAALAVSMTTTAALLGRIDPSPANATPSIDPETLAVIAEAIVNDDTQVDSQLWRGVTIETQPYVSSTGLLLVATASPTDSHFMVDGGGRPHRADVWRRQEHLPEHPATIRIVVATAGRGSAPSPAQRETVDAILSALINTLRPDGGFLPIVINDDAYRAGADPRV